MQMSGSKNILDLFNHDNNWDEGLYNQLNVILWTSAVFWYAWPKSNKLAIVKLHWEQM